MLPDTAGRVGFGLSRQRQGHGQLSGQQGRPTAEDGPRWESRRGRPGTPPQTKAEADPAACGQTGGRAGPVVPAPDVGPTASGEPRVLVKVPLRGGRVAEATVTWKSTDARCATPEAFAADVQQRFELDDTGTKAIAADIARQLAAHRAYAAALAPPPSTAAGAADSALSIAGRAAPDARPREPASRSRRWRCTCAGITPRQDHR